MKEGPRDFKSIEVVTNVALILVLTSTVDSVKRPLCVSTVLTHIFIASLVNIKLFRTATPSGKHAIEGTSLSIIRPTSQISTMKSVTFKSDNTTLSVLVPRSIYYVPLRIENQDSQISVVHSVVVRSALLKYTK